MFHVETLRVSVKERLAAAAEEIFALFEKTIAQFEQELCRSEKENQRKQRLLDQVNERVLLHPAGSWVHITSPSPVGPSPNQETTETEQIKEEPEEEGCFPAFSVLCVKTEESSHLQIETEHQEEAQEENISSEPFFHSDTGYFKGTNSYNLKRPFFCPDSQMETEAVGYQYNSARIEYRKTEGQNSGELEYNFAPESGVTVTNKNVPGTDKRAEKKIYQCCTCNKQCGSKQILDRHLRVHTGERPYSCSICGKTFANKGNLDKHIRIHTGERPYSCSFCNKNFSQSSSLKSHMRTHTAERPYSCLLCPKRFTDNSTLKKHIQIHTKSSQKCTEVLG